MLLIVMVSMNLSVIWNFRDSLRSIFSTIGVLVSHAKGFGWGISHTVNRMHPLKVLLSRCGKFMFLVKVPMNWPRAQWARIIDQNNRTGAVTVGYEKANF